MTVQRAARRPRSGSGVTRPALALVLAVVGWPTLGQEPQSWIIQLRAELQQQQRCELAEFLSQREVPLAGQLSREGRIRCRDGREFDYSRERENDRFIIRLCQPVVC